MQDTEAKVIEFITQLAIVLITAIVGFAIGRWDNKMNLRRETRKERLDNFYMPFVKLYDLTHMASAYDFLNFEPEIQRQYVEMLVSNMVYTSKFLREYIIQFMMLYHIVFIDDEEYDGAGMELNKTFNTICELMFEEYGYLKEKLYYSLGDKIRNINSKRRLRKKAKKDDVLMNNL